MPGLNRALRARSVAVVATGILVAATGCVELSGPAVDPAVPTDSVGVAEPTESDEPATPAPATGDVAGLLADLQIADEGSMDGYSRDRFAHWSSHADNCNTRELVLQRDSTEVQVGDDCYPTTGQWHSAYDDVRTDDPSEFDIDHMVPLAEAWRSGADEWTDAEREAFANDLDSPQLIAVSASSNRAKGDQDPAQWMPDAQPYWCDYVAAWVEVKHAWQLHLDRAEYDAIADVLAECN